MAPNTTEILFALGLGERVVGVTRYCDYPAEVTEIPKVGGYVDPGYEQIVALKPDLVVLLTSHRDTIAELEKLGIATLVTPHETVADIHDAILRIGRACGSGGQAEELSEDLERRRLAVQRAVEKRPRPGVLVCIGRDTSSGNLAGMYMAGRNGYYDELIEFAGGRNAYRNEKIAFPQLSAESVIALNPDVIIDIVAEVPEGGATPEAIARQWDRLRSVAAVRDGRVHVVVGRRALSPGPRYVDFLEELASLIHPEAFAGDAD